MAKNKGENSNSGIAILMICGVLAIGLIIACVFFPDALFGWLK